MNKKQTVMDGIDTDLSKAADALLDARTAVYEAKAHLEEMEVHFINTMREKRKNSLTHDGHTIVIKKGHTTKDSILFK